MAFPGSVRLDGMRTAASRTPSSPRLPPRSGAGRLRALSRLQALDECREEPPRRHHALPWRLPGATFIGNWQKGRRLKHGTVLARSQSREVRRGVSKGGSWFQNGEEDEADDESTTSSASGLMVELSIDENDDPRILRLNDSARVTLNKLRLSMFGYSRAYKALFAYHVADAGIQLWQSFYPGSLPLVTESEYSLVLNSTALINYWLCAYFLETCGNAFTSITAEREDSLPEVLKGVVYLTLTCNELTVVAWLFTLALIIESSMIWDGTKYVVGGLIYVFALVRIYGYFLVNKYYGQLGDFVSAVLSDTKQPVNMPKEISKTEQVLLKVCLGPLAVLSRDEVEECDGGYRFSDSDLELFRSLTTSMFTCGVSYLVATSCTAVYYGAAVAVGDDAEVVSALYSVPEYLSQFLSGVLLLETTDAFVYIINGRPYIRQFITACGKLESVFIGLTNITAGVILGGIFDLFWGDEFISDFPSFDLMDLQDALNFMSL